MTVQFYDQKQQVYNKNDYLVLAGDLNVRIGKTLIDIMGKEGEETLNTNGKRLIDFAAF